MSVGENLGVLVMIFFKDIKKKELLILKFFNWFWFVLCNKGNCKCKLNKYRFGI